MSRLFWLVLTLVGFVLTVVTKSPVVLGLGLFFAFVGFVGLLLAMVAARVSASARPETAMASVDDFGALRKRAEPTVFTAPTPRKRDGDSDPTA